MNKENFWNGLYEQYPKSVKEFCDFIDEYKSENNWNELFGEKIKFHHIPVEMQLGIWMQFQFKVLDDIDITITADVFHVINLYEWASEFFRQREIELKK